MSQPLIKVSFVDRGDFFIMSRSAGLKLRAVAGKPSVTKFTHNNCTGMRASGTPRAAARKMLKKYVFCEHRRYLHRLPDLSAVWLGHDAEVLSNVKISGKQRNQKFQSSLRQNTTDTPVLHAHEELIPISNQIFIILAILRRRV